MNSQTQAGEVQTAWHVLVVEDDPEMVAYLASCIDRSDRLVLQAVAHSVEAARLLLEDVTRTFDVLLVDLGLPDGSGLDVLRYARVIRPACESMVISMFGDGESVLDSIEAGALGYIHKDAYPADITQTIVDMKSGGSPISPTIARLLMERLRVGPRDGRPVDEWAAPACSPESVTRLSPREHEVLSLMSKGFSYAEIGKLQGVTVNTVRSHIKNLYQKLSVHSRSEAVFEARSIGLLSAPSRIS